MLVQSFSELEYCVNKESSCMSVNIHSVNSLCSVTVLHLSLCFLILDIMFVLFRIELSVKDIYKIEICQVCNRVGYHTGYAFSSV
jgi:hypothetical protein